MNKPSHENRLSSGQPTPMPAPYSPGTLARVQRMEATKSMRLPEQFSSEYAWAADWVAKNGVTLPPDTTELRSLRNWFCFKVDCYKKGSLRPQVQAQLALHGIDLSQYRALNTGKGECEPDEPFIDQLLAHHAATGTYDLNKDSDPQLLDFQARVLARFREAGRSKRLTKIEAQLEGLNLGRWRQPGDSEPQDDAWWAMAAKFRAESKAAPAFRGILHPRTPAALLAWAREQQHLAAGARGSISPGQRGELKDLGILRDAAQREVHKERRKARMDLGAGSRGARVDKRLDTFLGAACLVRMYANKRPLMAMCTEFAADPAEIEVLLEATRDALVLVPQSPARVRKDLVVCRQLEALNPGMFTAEGLKRMSADKRPVLMTPAVERLGRIVEEIRAAAARLRIKQDLD